MLDETGDENDHHHLVEANKPRVTINNLFVDNKPRHKLKHKVKDNVKPQNSPYYWQMDQLTIPTINNQKIKNLYLKPGKSRHFILFFMISCYIPIITAVIGPIAHMFSIACLVNKWRMEKETGKEVNDSASVVVLNCVSLFLGGISNITLLLHFSNKISYIKAQYINITGWGLSCLFLLIDIIIFRCLEFDSNGYSKGIGFWFAVYTCILYFLCTVLLMIHLAGYKMEKYRPTFNLSEEERAVMLYTFALFLWISWGSWLYSKLLFTDVSYGVSMYALLCGALTVGFGDIFSSKTGGKIISMIYFLCSIIIIGLIINLTSQIIKNTFRSTIHLHLCEKARMEQLRVYNLKMTEFQDRKNQQDWIESQSTDTKYTTFAYSSYQSGNNYSDVVQFTQMRKLHLHYQSMTRHLGFGTSLTLFSLFWLFGAMVFKFSEDWDYFDAVYFSFLDCLLTIGYGDFILVSGSGRAFFVLFALAAIPLMTSLINSIGSSLSNIGWTFVKYSVLTGRYLYDFATFSLIECLNMLKISNIKKVATTKEFSKTYSKRPLPFYLTIDKKQQLDDDLQDLLEIGFEINVLQETQHRDRYEYEWIGKVMRLCKDYELLSQISPNYKLTYQEWIDFFRLSYKENKKVLQTKNFWLSHESPIRFDTNEPRFVYLQLAQLLKQHLNEKKKMVQKIHNVPVNPQLLGRHVNDSIDASSEEISENEQVIDSIDI